MLTGDKGVQMHLWIHIIQYPLSSHDHPKRERRHPSLVTWAFSLVGMDLFVFYTRIVRHSLLGHPGGSTFAIWPTNAKLSSDLSLQLALDSCPVNAGDWSRGLHRAEENEARRFPFSASTSIETDYIGCGVQYLRLPRREYRDSMVRKPNFPWHFSIPGPGGSGKLPETCPAGASALVTGGKSQRTVGGIQSASRVQGALCRGHSDSAMACSQQDFFQIFLAPHNYFTLNWWSTWNLLRENISLLLVKQNNNNKNPLRLIQEKGTGQSCSS